MIDVLTQNFAAACTRTFLGLKPWYAYLKVQKDAVTGSCGVVNFNLLPKNGAASDVPLILLAVVDDLLRLAGLMAVIFVIYGAVQYVTSQGNPEQASRAQSTIVNALVGLALSIIAVATVAFFGTRLSQ